jgi:hypothetical protein
MLGLNYEEVQSGNLLQVDPLLTQGLEQRIESVARDMLQGKESSTMTGYMPIMQKALAWAWHKQEQQRQQQAGSEPATTAAMAAAAAAAEPPDSDAPGDSTVQSPSSSLLMNIRTFLDFITAAERPAAAMRREFSRVLSGGGREGESFGGGSSSAPQSQAQSADDLASVQELRQLLNGGPTDVNLHDGRFSLGNWKKYLNALTYLQEKQQHILLGKTRGTSIWWQRQLWIPPCKCLQYAGRSFT